VRVFSSKRRTLTAAVVIVLALFLLRPGASRLKSRISSSISSGVGRPVEIGSVHFQLLPRPGFDLENLVVYDDPAFGAEPMLRASEVTAALRLTSLLRGRLEIARLDLTEPSLNLVHGENGRWNLEALLERTAHNSLAPTAKAKSEVRPGFPYIEGTSARINFKSGPEKKPYALTNADFSLWQESENEWGVRLKAQPIRSDLNLNDTGVLQVNGTWQRAAALHDTPVQFNMEWSRAQLGQLTKLFTGTDQGWRGGMQLDVSLTGTPAKLQISSTASIEDFRRYDIASGEPLRLAAHCEGQYSSVDHIFHQMICGAPAGTGQITVKGDFGFPGSHRYELLLSAADVPASAMIALLRRAKKNLPQDLTASGMLRGSISIQEDAAAAKHQAEGRGEISDFHLASATDKTEIGPQTIPFVFSNNGQVGRNWPKSVAWGKSAPGVHGAEGPHLEFGPFALGSGHAASPTVAGWMDRSGYDVSVAGEAEIARVLRVARMLGVPALPANAEGTAQMDLEIAGPWAKWGYGTQSGFPGPQVTGTAKLRNVRALIHGAGGPVEISAADMQLLPDGVHVGRVSAKVAGATWTGSLEMPRGCGNFAACGVHFNLNASQIETSQLAAWVSPSAKEKPWYRMLESSTQPGTSFAASLRASGRLSAARVQVQNLTATQLTATVNVDRGVVTLSDLNADFLDGRHRGEWRADFKAKPAVCSGQGNLSGVSLAGLADTMKHALVAGAANASYEVKGSCPADFWASAEGTLQFDMRDGLLPHVSLSEDEGPLKIARFSGHAKLHEGHLEFENAKMDSANGKFQVSGTASLRHEIDLKLARSGSVSAHYIITGTLADPHVIQTANPETQARLKPEPAK